jgi:hypothetical protein
MMNFKIFNRYCLAVAFFAFGGFADAAGQLTVGVQYDGWNAPSTAPAISGYEVMVPFSAHYKLDDTFGIFGQANFVGANYTGTLDGATSSSYSPADFSDSVLGTDIHFDSFGLPALLNVSLNLPSGNQDWETKQQVGNIPTEFIDSRYRGRGFGVNAMYGLSIPAGGDSQFGAALGYLHSGSFNTEEIPDLDLGDSIFLGVNRIEAFGQNKSSVIRVSTLFFMPTTENGTQELQEGPNINASYAFNDPAGFSYEVGAQLFTPASGTAALPEPHNFLGQRFYVAPSLALGNLLVAAQLKYITPNDYATFDPQYDGGGFVMGLNPSYVAPLDSVSDLKFSAGYDFIVAHNSGQTVSGRADINYNYWQLGTNYEIKL